MQTEIAITGTHVNYYHLCYRKLWLFSHGLQMEHTSGLVAEGRFVHENSYKQRATKYKELAIGPIKIDHFDAVRKIVREVKKSNRKEAGHIAQLKYYLYIVERMGVVDVSGVLEYPTLRTTETVHLTDSDRDNIREWLVQIQSLINAENCPVPVHKKMCKRCAYFDFCYSE